MIQNIFSSDRFEFLHAGWCRRCITVSNVTSIGSWVSEFRYPDCHSP